MIDAQGKVKTWSKSAQRIKGYTAEEILGKSYSKFFCEEDIAAGKPELELKTSLQLGCFEEEGWRVRKDGTRFWASVLITPLFKRGIHIGYTKVTRDLTQKKRLATLEEKDRQKNHFLAMLAHELRNPLAPVRTNMHIIKEKYGHILDNDCLQLMVASNRQLDHLSRMIDDLLDVARVTHGKIRLNLQPVRVCKSIEGALTVLRCQNMLNRHTVTVDCSKEVIVEADPMRLEQILINLITNAVKFSKAGKDICICVVQEAGWVHVAVRDCGCGIRPEDLPYIFDLFYQSDQSIERTEGGLGIGLTVVKKLMDLHGGAIKVNTNLDKGTSFNLSFREMENHTKKEVIDKPAGRRILIVEDNKDAAQSLSVLFSLDNHEVRVCHDGNTAVVQAHAFDPDVVILDIGLPGLSGFEVARALRSSTVTEDVKIVAVSGYSGQDDFTQAKSLGINEYLSKPADPEKLRKMILDSA